MSEQGPPLRLFWALVPPADVVEALTPAVEVAQQAHPDLRWTRPATWHVTLAFLGAVPQPLVESLGAAVRAAVEGRPPVPVRLSRRASTPGGGRGVVWLAVAEDAALAALAEVVRHAAGLVAEVDTTHAWRGHLTLARTRRHTSHPAARAREAAATYSGPHLAWSAEEVVLLHSTTGSGGPEYRALTRIPLSGRTGGA